ncbi:DUF2076 domain-containing protein [Buchnera aphidicola]|uniref:DUF2076 domain-containing protein n=1 Tax=Buchnera aphidicola (Artemisaphis artemisicola) TaxID=1241836 RepID=A0A4D6XIA5_9GAMM|nr:DUF2076 domain-containing protein [Buchnera aphidicola]QCI15873.1 DUF2076 domain-containing protein [Buchnera aphidicola (Artemisaphis artemisicola)]
MKDEEKNLIENLFHRLKNAELKSSERDISADNLIQMLVKKQPSSSYYMAQTILIQETAIKKMSRQIEELKRNINFLNQKEQNKKSSFLSNLFKKHPSSYTKPNDSNVWKQQEYPSKLNNSHNFDTSSRSQTLSTSASNNSSGFLKNALQTATGVAGGMILGNMLMNVFNHSKPEEEMFDTIDQSSINHNINSEDNFSDNTTDNHLVNYESEELNSNDTTNDIYDTDDNTYDNTDINDENFI